MLAGKTAVTQSEKTKLKKAGTIRRSHSARSANCVVVIKKDRTAGVCKDFRGMVG